MSVPVQSTPMKVEAWQIREKEAGKKRGDLACALILGQASGQSIQFVSTVKPVKENLFSSTCAKIASLCKDGSLLWEIFTILAKATSTGEVLEPTEDDTERMNKIQSFYSKIIARGDDVNVIANGLSTTLINYQEAVQKGQSTFFDIILNKHIEV